MRKITKKISIFATAAIMSLGALSLGACGYSFSPLSGDTSGDINSNGGFVVEKGNYVYFINGVEAHTSDNTYGSVVKGALMRIAKTDLAEGKGDKAETVVPSLMVAADYTSGLYIYGDRVYYATPNNVQNTSGVIEQDYLDFKSARLDGSDIQSYFRVSSNSTPYRFVEAGSGEKRGVYVLYAEGSSTYTLHSYDTAEKVDTVLAEGATGYVLDADKTNPNVYYTMNVSVGLDTDGGSRQLDYNQIYRVSADVKEAPYEYTWRQDYLDDHDGKAPYTNLGTVVLDGIGSSREGSVPQFTHDWTEGVTPLTVSGYTYSLETYANGGIYFTRSDINKTSSTGEDGWLYYLSEDKTAGSWNSITGNAGENLDVVAQNTTKASASALFYLEGNTHHYLFVDSDRIVRADVGANGIADELTVARGVSGATLMYRDDADATYKYVYFNRTSGSGVSAERAVYNGTWEDYSNLQGTAEYKPVKVLDVQHASGWYGFEMIGNTLFYADAEAVGANSYNYAAAVDLTGADGKLMNNAEIAALNEKYEEITDSETGYLAKLSDKDRTKLSDAVKYYFFTGESGYFRENIDEAIAEGKADNYLYNEDDKKDFESYVKGEGDAAAFVDDAGNSYRTRSYFITALGKMNEADEESSNEYWKNSLERYTPPAEEEGLAWWAWTLIGVGIGLVVAGAGIAVWLVLRAKKKRAEEGKPRAKRMAVDTTDDRSVDVYADEPEETAPEAIAEVAEEAEVQPEEAPAAEEEPAEEKAPSEAEEAPATDNPEE